MKYFILFMLNMFLASCSAGNTYIDCAYTMINSYAKEVKKKEGFILTGNGGSLTKDIKTLFLHFNSSRELNIEQARLLYVKSVEGLVHKVNADETIRPYLHDYPFTWKNVDMDIVFYKGTKRVGNGKVAFIMTVKGIVYYEAYDLEKDDFVTLHQEPYEEALRIVYPN